MIQCLDLTNLKLTSTYVYFDVIISILFMNKSLTLIYFQSKNRQTYSAV